MSLNLKDHIRTVPDFPKPGILFYDIGTLLAHAPAFKETIHQLAETVKNDDLQAVVGIESRGFLFGAALAHHLDLGFMMVRKKGKLPGETLCHEYALEYGTDVIEAQTGILPAKTKVLLFDDLLATGGTAAAALTLCRKMELEVQRAAFVCELTFLGGRAQLDTPVSTLLTYDS